MLTTESVLALAPDDSSAKAARGLVTPAQWPTLGVDDAAVWGECQGSGAKPYQTQVDLSGPAFRCSCPSRKFPCKHGLALLLLRVQHAGAFKAGAQPAWVSEWLASRADKAQKKEERQAVAVPAEPAKAAERATKSEAQRWQRIESAAQDLQRWLADRIAAGLGSLGQDVTREWQTMAARLVDAQAPGLAQRVREAAAGVREGADWPECTLQRLGLLQLACDAIARRAALDAATAADLRALVGWPTDKDEVLGAGEAVADRWTVLGVAVEERDDKLIERRVWLHGRTSARRALLLDHAHGGRGFEQSWVAGASVNAKLVFFPGAAALRALCAELPSDVAPAEWPRQGLDDEWDRIAVRAASSPWVRWHPLVVREAVPLRDGAHWLAVTPQRTLPIALPDAHAWPLAACSGGHALHLAGEWDGRFFRPLAAWQGEQPVPVWQRGVAQ